jgi:hypothetical protein
MLHDEVLIVAIVPSRRGWVGEVKYGDTSASSHVQCNIGIGSILCLWRIYSHDSVKFTPGHGLDRHGDNCL